MLGTERATYSSRMGLSMMIPLRFPPDQRWLEGPVAVCSIFGAGIGGAVRVLGDPSQSQSQPRCIGIGIGIAIHCRCSVYETVAADDVI